MRVNDKRRSNHLPKSYFSYLIFMSLPIVIEQLKAIDADPSRLLKEEGQQINFMKEWIFLNATQQQKKEFSYVWNLVHGWDIEQIFPSSLVTSSSYINNQAKIPREDFEKTSQPQMNYLGNENQGVLQYLSKNEVFIRFQSNFIWINPTKPFPTFPKELGQCIVVLTSPRIPQLIDFLELTTIKLVKLITTQIIYRKIKHLATFLSKIQSYSLPTTYLLKADEYFEYGNIMWLMRENCWLQPSFDLHLSFPHTKQAFLVESAKLSETRLVYYGWKKGLITEGNYQKYIRQWERDVIKVSPRPQLIPRLPQKKKEKIDWYLNFIEKELINTLDEHEHDHLFTCCELIQLIPNQIIAKTGYRFDYLYILLEGQFQLRDPRQPADNSKFYGLKELQKGQEFYSFTLASVTKGTILRIDKSNVIFHIYDRLF